MYFYAKIATPWKKSDPLPEQSPSKIWRPVKLLPFENWFGGSTSLCRKGEGCPLSQEPYIIWSSLMVHMCTRIIYPGFFLHFFQILTFWVNSRAKKQQMAWNDKKLCLQAQHIWLSIHHMTVFFLLQKFKMMTSLDVFSIFFKFRFCELLPGRGVKKAKNGPKWQKNMPHFVSQELYLIWLWFLGHVCKMVVSPANFFFFKSLIFLVFRIHQMPKGNSEVCPTFLTCVWFFC